VEAFTRRCIDSVFRYIDEWRTMTRRVGFWVDLDAAYVTFHQSYVESVWWALSRMFERGLLYQDYKIVWWWPQGGTALSSGEVGLGYKTVDDPSVVVRFPVEGEGRTSFLAWTTTPWTLPSNVALAVHPDLPYVTVELEGGERVILAAALAPQVLADRPHTIVDERPGRALCGMRYEPPFQYATPEGGTPTWSCRATSSRWMPARAWSTSPRPSARTTSGCVRSRGSGSCSWWSPTAPSPPR
jgi:isoleucyl-tRNA synthetase